MNWKPDGTTAAAMSYKHPVHFQVATAVVCALLLGPPLWFAPDPSPRINVLSKSPNFFITFDSLRQNQLLPHRKSGNRDWHANNAYSEHPFKSSHYRPSALGTAPPPP
ncbi:hypothetical protein IscW_ISCW019758 [Ixodes scapularis]|uniref:Uncharacterized protein n=1 Tax=Ixodes scapularis TaxID=6945 RepID=B7PX47_IXOSC|nr:hypothetical protein IscW_ISCW019758 [Ixodes scapularis]|eukprot:XP_002410505.1 hypothetical protein IscW_ISCW019758 [Ixodes scapularis]